MDRSSATPPFRQLIMVPAVITLATTVLRLVGELLQWSPIFFSREAGGAGALVGIVWLVPVFGIYFAIRLAWMGLGPVSRGRAIGHAVVAFLSFIALTIVASKLRFGALVNIPLFNVLSPACAAIAYRGWPALGKTEIAYGLTARIPVAMLMLVAMFARWGTHYELGPPGLPSMAVVPTWLWIGLFPQLLFWIGITVILGSLFGSVALLAVRTPIGAAAPAA